MMIQGVDLNFTEPPDEKRDERGSPLPLLFLIARRRREEFNFTETDEQNSEAEYTVQIWNFLIEKGADLNKKCEYFKVTPLTALENDPGFVKNPKSILDRATPVNSVPAGRLGTGAGAGAGPGPGAGSNASKHKKKKKPKKGMPPKSNFLVAREEVTNEDKSEPSQPEEKAGGNFVGAGSAGVGAAAAETKLENVDQEVQALVAEIRVIQKRCLDFLKEELKPQFVKFDSKKLPKNHPLVIQWESAFVPAMFNACLSEQEHKELGAAKEAKKRVEASENMLRHLFSELRGNCDTADNELVVNRDRGAAGNWSALYGAAGAASHGAGAATGAGAANYGAGVPANDRAENVYEAEAAAHASRANINTMRRGA